MPLPVRVNANWPLLRILWSPTSNGVYDTTAVRYTDITRRCLKSWAISRGRQYELDTYMAGTFTATCKNADGALNPMSTSSPLAPYVTPYRRIQVTAQWPPTPNELSGDRATAGEATPYPPGAIPAAMNITAALGTPVLAASATAFQGTQVYQTAVPGSGTLGFSLLTLQWHPVETPGLGLPLLYYSWSIYVRSVTAGANAGAAAQIRWKNASGTQIAVSEGSATPLTGATSAPWVRIAVTAPPPAGAAMADLAVVLRTAAPAGSWSFQADGAQFEQGGAPTGWRQPGTWYPQFTGGVERYPQTTDLNNTRVLSPITATDTLALLPQSKLTASLNGLLSTPNGPGAGAADFIYGIGEPSGSGAFSDSTGNRASAVVFNSKYGPGTVAPGTAITSTDPGQGFVGGGASATVTRFTVGSGYTSGNAVPGKCSMINLAPNGIGQLGPPNSGAFTRMIAFRNMSAAVGGGPYLWRAFATVVNGGTLMACEFDLNTVGADIYPGWYMTDGTNTLDVTGPNPVTAGDWHLTFIGIDATRKIPFYQLDNTLYAAGTPFATPLNWTTAFIQDSIGASTVQPTGGGVFAYNGDAAFAAQWPFALTNGQMNEIYGAWRTAYQGDSSDQRAGHILNWAKYTGPRALNAGTSTSLGPATDVDGTDALSALQQVQDTEGGQLFAAKDGTVTLYPRSRRLAVPVPTVVFGAHTGAGETPYESCELDYDPSLLENDVEITQTSTGQILYGANTLSQTSTGTRTYAKNNQSTDPTEVQSQASYYAAEFGHAKVRVATLVIHPSALSSKYPQAWPVCLGLELDQCVQVNWRPIGADVGAVDAVPILGFLEKIDIMGGPGAEAYWTLQISSAPGTGGGPSVATAKPWNLALLHTTLHGAAAAGQPTITIDALPTAAFSTLAQNLPAAGPGFQLTLGSGLPTQETLTILSVSATAPGWSTATVTFTANLANNHADKEIVREPLGLASASTWPQLDAYSAIDSMQLTY